MSDASAKPTTMLRLLRVRKYLTVAAAAEALGIPAALLHPIEVLGRRPNAAARRRLELAYGRTWRELARPATRAAIVDVDVEDLPKLTVLALLRRVQFPDRRTAAEAIGCNRHALASWERGARCVRAAKREALERVFGLPYSVLSGPAPRLGIPAAALPTKDPIR